MQKIYERIEWENDPSTKTPLNEDNLNKMDYALDQIDTRVVELSGYQEAAAASATAAKTSEDNAKDSEIASALSATSANLSAFNASASATNAHTSETNASTSASNASTSETNAASSATSASLSATSAGLSAFNAAASEANALTYKNNAETSKDRAVLAETNSHGSEVNASMSATSSALSAFNASVSESNAQNKALLAESWAVGMTGVRPDENTNNAKYWSERAQAVAHVTVDNVFSTTSLNPVENRVITNQHVNKSISQQDGVHGLRYNDEILQVYDEIEEIWKNVVNKSNTVPYTLDHDEWVNNTYSLESDYPSTDYNIDVDLDISEATPLQRNAYIFADFSGYNPDSNILYARGIVPTTVDIPVILTLN